MVQVFGNRYEVVEQVGTGGMATVYLGRDSVLKRDVAIKVLHPHLAGRDDARRRFNREAQAIARLHHTNIVDVFDFSGGEDDEAFLVTEFVQGETLTGFCKTHGPFLPQSAALIGYAVAGALAHAHATGVIHRDIKPDNLMISKGGKIKLMDFGIATAIDLEQMTATGAILGSPAHMAPEQIDGQDIDARVDVFAFGTLLYYLVTGRLPFMASNPHALFRLILECRYEDAGQHNPAVGRRFEEIISTCLTRDREQRFSSMAAVQDALEAYLREHRMNDPDKLLRRLLTAPEQFQLEWRPVLVQVLCAKGRNEARQGSLALAIDAYNRALAIDNNAVEPRRGLNDLTSRSRRRRRVRGLAAALALTIVGVGLYKGVEALAEQRAAAPVEVQVDRPATAVDAPPLPPAMDPRVVTQAAQPKLQAAGPVVAGAPDANPVAATGSAATAAQPTVAEAKPVPAPPAAEPAAASVRIRRRAPRNKLAAAAGPASDGPRSAGPKEVEPPAPKGGLIDVALGSNPPNALLYLDGQLISTSGYKRRPLRTGSSHVLKCKANDAACPGCNAEERRFKVPDKPPTTGVLTIKCDFSAQRKALGLGGGLPTR